MAGFKPGDRVRYTLTGEADVFSGFKGNLYVNVHGADFEIDLEFLIMELIEPEIVLPTTPGSIVIIDPTGEHGETTAWVLMGGDRPDLWYSEGYRDISEVVIEDARKFGYRIVEVEQ